jgi:branched-chain amino acid transport system ATP-binding protein
MTRVLVGEGVSKHFGGLKAVDGVDFHLDEGEILGLIGPNGAGKTTLFSVAAGSLEPTSGRVEMDGQAVSGKKAHSSVRRGICRTHQIVRPFPNLTVLDNVLVGAYYGKPGRATMSRAEALDLLDWIGLGDRAHRMPTELTLAGKKRLEVARALATKPRVLLLDEVIAGLNPTEARNVVQLIRRIREQGVSIVMIEHVMHAVMGLSDRVMVLDHGQKIAEGTPSAVANDPQVIEAYLGKDEEVAEMFHPSEAEDEHA